jgi:hypothetical protein
LRKQLQLLQLLLLLLLHLRDGRRNCRCCAFSGSPFTTEQSAHWSASTATLGVAAKLITPIHALLLTTAVCCCDVRHRHMFRGGGAVCPTLLPSFYLSGGGLKFFHGFLH